MTLSVNSPQDNGDPLHDLIDPDAPSEKDDTGDLGYPADMQQAMLSAVCTDEPIARLAATAIHPKAFSEKSHQGIAEIAFDHIKKYNVLPTKATVLYEFRQRFAEDKSL